MKWNAVKQKGYFIMFIIYLDDLLAFRFDAPMQKALNRAKIEKTNIKIYIFEIYLSIECIFLVLAWPEWIYLKRQFDWYSWLLPMRRCVIVLSADIHSVQHQHSVSLNFNITRHIQPISFIWEWICFLCVYICVYLKCTVYFCSFSVFHSK